MKIIRTMLLLLCIVLCCNSAFAQSRDYIYTINDISAITVEDDEQIVTIEVKKNSDGDSVPLIVLAVYDGAGHLSECQIIPCDLKGEESHTYSLLTKTISTESEVKCFVWDTIANQTPLSAQKALIDKNDSEIPTIPPTEMPTIEPTATPTAIPTIEPTATPTVSPTASPTVEPTATPTVPPTAPPTVEPTATPTVPPTVPPTVEPTATPTVPPTAPPTVEPTATPTVPPTAPPTVEPTATPTVPPTVPPTAEPTATPEEEMLPDYAVSEVQEMVEKIQSAKTDNSLTFSAMSDFHLFTGSDLKIHRDAISSAKLAASGLAEIKKYVEIDADVLLGDYSWTSNEFTAEMCKTDINTVNEIFSEVTEGSPTIWCIGNHDLNYAAGRDRMLTTDELYEYIGKNTTQSVTDEDNPQACYGYIDYPQQQIRMIYLNTCDVHDEFTPVDGEVAQAEWIGHKQIEWIVSTALDFSHKENASDWGIVFVSHHPINYGWVTFVRFMQMLEDYRDGNSGTISYNAENVTYSIDYDFTETKQAEILCAINGHSHNFRADYVSSRADTSSTSYVEPWLLRMTIPNMCASRYNEAASVAGEFGDLYGEFDAEGNPVYYEKTTETAEGTSFCVVTVNRESRKVYAHCFGAGIDRVYDIDKPENTD